ALGLERGIFHRSTGGFFRRARNFVRSALQVFLIHSSLPSREPSKKERHECGAVPDGFQPAMYCAPLMVIVAPVIKAASSLLRYATILPISPDLPRRPIGIVATTFASAASGIAVTMSVSI